MLGANLRLYARDREHRARPFRQPAHRPPRTRTSLANSMVTKRTEATLLASSVTRKDTVPGSLKSIPVLQPASLLCSDPKLECSIQVGWIARGNCLQGSSSLRCGSELSHGGVVRLDAARYQVQFLRERTAGETIEHGPGHAGDS